MFMTYCGCKISKGFHVRTLNKTNLMLFFYLPSTVVSKLVIQDHFIEFIYRKSGKPNH